MGKGFPAGGAAMSYSLTPAPLDLAEALDRIALQKLAWSYCHGIDRRDLALVRSLYWDDAIDDHGAMFCGSPDEYVAWLPSMLDTFQATRHFIANMNYLICGYEAEGELVTTAWHRSADGSHDIVMNGRYLDQYRKREGVWKFYRRSLVLDWIEEHPAQAVTEDGVEQGRAGPDDPVYARLPMFARQRGKRED